MVHNLHLEYYLLDYGLTISVLHLDLKLCAESRLRDVLELLFISISA